MDYLDYWSSHPDKFVTPLIEHLELVGVVLALSIALSIVITLLVTRSRKVTHVVIQVLNGVYSIPSLALFALLIPVTGLGAPSAIIVMVAYNQFLLVRNFTQGFAGVDKAVIEAAVGMGMSPGQVLLKIKLPLALPTIMAGIRLASISTIGIATIAASISAGGLGRLLFEGLRTMNQYKIVGGVLMCAVVALLANVILKTCENLLTRKFVK